ncbi:MAG: large conductance mechanosensitive channel protein MscL [Rhodothermales bacterium]|nr:large conductance mechanosensitive channel protein MscL [Rhodothermales bacterium]
MSFLSEFRKFAMRGNLVDLAIGFTVGAAFSTVAKSLVDDLIMPPLGLLLGRTDFSDAYVLLKAGETPPPYASLAAAEAAGATTWNYGVFLTNALTLLLIALAMFVVIRAVNKVGETLKDEFGNADETPPDQPETKKCAYCRQAVPFQASRCAHCTSFLGTEGGPLQPDARITPQT